MMGHVLLVCLLLEVLALFAVPVDWQLTWIAMERQWVLATLGQTSAWSLWDGAAAFWDEAVVAPGVPAELYGITGSGEIGRFAAGRIDVLLLQAEQVVHRFYLLLAFLPFLAIVGIASLMDGQLFWLRARYTYTFTSPLMHRWTVGALQALMMVFLALLLIPAPLPPHVTLLFYALLGFGAAAALRTSMKRI